MRGNNKFAEALPNLCWETKNFLIRYGLRNPQSGKGLGMHGLLSLKVVKMYANALETAYRKIHRHWGREHPICDGTGKIAVSILGGISDPVMFAQDWEFPSIVLPSFNNEATIKSSWQRIKAEIAHEVCHVFNFTEHPLTDFFSARWAWFDEGLAVYSEGQVFKNNLDYRRFLPNWVVFPEISLDSSVAEYQASQIVRYLAARFGEQFVNEVWTKSTREETPVEAMNRLLQDGLKFVSKENGQADVFSDYCRDAYFLRDPKSLLYAPEVFDRFGERASTENFELQPGSPSAEAESNLDHLACRYFRYSVTPGVKSLTLRLEASKEGNSPLKAEVAVMARDGKNALAKRLVPIPLSSANDKMRLTGKIDLPRNVEIDHVVVIVTNCGLKRATDNVYESSDDEQEFRLQVVAEG
ncbi:MAG: DUF6055 domain-containing protein [Acidobacteriota bacterium]|nr:DUF6055 domain-containing protein [Acidobacteriota bacterium]